MRFHRVLTAILVTVILSACVDSPARDQRSGASNPSIPPSPLGTETSRTDAPTSNEARENRSAAWFAVADAALEPMIAANANGTLFYTARKPFEPPLPAGVPRLLRSKDGARTWEDVTPRLASLSTVPPATGDPVVHVDPSTGRLFLFDMFPTLACAVLSWSDDEGASWSHNPAACATAPPYDRQTLVTAKPRTVPTVGYPRIVVQCVNRVSDTACARSLDGGRSFLPAGVPFAGHPTGGAGACGGMTGQLAAGPDGRLFLPKEACGRAVVAISEDDGLTWRVAVVSTAQVPGGEQPVVAIDAQGTVGLAYRTASGGLHLVTSSDGGKSWSEPASILPTGATSAALPAIAAGPAGVAISHMATLEEGDWYGMITTVPGFAAVLDGGIASTIVRPERPLAPGRTAEQLSLTVGDFLGVAVDGAGNAWATFVDDCAARCPQGPGIQIKSGGPAIVGTVRMD